VLRRTLAGLARHAKLVILRVAAAVLPGRRAPAPGWQARVRRLLFVRYDGIGDLVMVTGALRAVAARHPALSIDVLTQAQHAEVLDGLPFIRHVLGFTPARRSTFPPRVLAALRRRHYDAVIDGAIERSVDGFRFFERVPVASALLFLATGARYRIGQGGRPGDAIYNVPATLPADGSVQYVVRAAALAAPFGVGNSVDEIRPELRVREAERAAALRRWSEAPVGGGVPAPPRRLLVNLSAWNAIRLWSAERYAEVLRHVRERHPGTAVVVIGVPEPYAIEGARRLASEFGALADVPPLPGAGVPPLRAVMALVATADVVLTPDTSVAHIAAAIGTPLVGLYLPMNRVTYVPLGARGRIVFAPREHMSTLEAAPVIEALDAVLAELAQPVRG
jgi:ADP-heptose:LPS heptosyltransferase